MRIVSLVPSWTETLIEAGANVVGRTRFCIHPKDRVKAIEAIGGTKSFDIEKLRALKPDLIILDREENTKEMAELAMSVAPTFVTHVESVTDLPRELARLSAHLNNEELNNFATRFERVLLKPILALHNDSFARFINPHPVQENFKSTKFVYCIWKDPWMAVGRKTFIASMLEQVGFEPNMMWPSGDEKYPKFEIETLAPDVLILLSSEPFPFAKLIVKEPAIFSQNQVALVNGESFSWFGIRALRFLEATKSGI